MLSAETLLTIFVKSCWQEDKFICYKYGGSFWKSLTMVGSFVGTCSASQWQGSLGMREGRIMWQIFPFFYLANVALYVVLLLSKACGGITGIEPWWVSTTWEQGPGKGPMVPSLSPQSA